MASIAEIRVKPGGWLGSNGRKANKRARKFWSFAPSTANSSSSGRIRTSARPRKIGPAGIIAWLARFVIWTVMILLTMFILLAVSLGLVHGYRSLTGSTHFAVSSVEISGNRQLSYAELLSLSGITVGESILEVSLAQINAKLLANPWVKSVTVRRVLPGGVSIHVQEREPFFWIQQAGALYYADHNGMPIVPVELGRFVSLPALIVEDEALTDRAVLQEWISAVERMEYPFGFPEVAWLKVEDANIVRFFLEDRGMEVALDLGDWREHGRLLNRVWQDLIARGELERVGRMAVMAGKVWVQAKQI